MHTICCSHQKSFAVFTNSVRIQIVKNNLFFSLPCNWLGLVFVDEETREQLKLYLTTRIHTSTTEATQQQPCLAHTYVLYTQTIVPYAMHRRVLNWVTICCDKSVRTRVCGFLNWDFPYLSIRPATILLQSDRLKKLLASHVRIRNQRYPSNQPTSFHLGQADLRLVCSFIDSIENVIGRVDRERDNWEKTAVIS